VVKKILFLVVYVWWFWFVFGIELDLLYELLVGVTCPTAFESAKQ